MLGCTWSTPRLIAESNFIWTEKYKTSPEWVNCIDFSTSRKVDTIETAHKNIQTWKRFLPSANEVAARQFFTPVCDFVHGGGLSVQGGLFPGKGISVHGVSVQRVPVRETPHTVKSGWYASYWNAFLCWIIFVHWWLGKKSLSGF